METVLCNSVCSNLLIALKHLFWHVATCSIMDSLNSMFQTFYIKMQRHYKVVLGNALSL